MYIERGLRLREVLESWRLYVERLCQRARELLGEVRVVVFGSVARGGLVCRQRRRRACDLA
jgi:predicted nucleotidyltransferase